MEKEKPLPKVFCLKMALLGEWWCADIASIEEEILKGIAAQCHAPVNDPALIKDRLYGGFRCENSERRHIWLNAGAYTYINPEANGPRNLEDRLEDWNMLLNGNTNKDDGFIGGGPFCEDAPI